MVRQLARWTLRGVKGALAAVALATLVGWPQSYGPAGGLEWWRWTVGEARVDAFRVGVGQYDGRVGVEWNNAVFANVELDYARRWAAKAGVGWSMKHDGTALYWEDRTPVSSWGPFRWKSEEITEAGRVASWHAFSFPCWLLALLAGAWPLASALLFVRRRRRASRRLRPNLCRRCGYDLRATPSADEATLATCPECGMPARGE